MDFDSHNLSSDDLESTPSSFSPPLFDESGDDSNTSQELGGTNGDPDDIIEDINVKFCTYVVRTFKDTTENLTFRIFAITYNPSNTLLLLNSSLLLILFSFHLKLPKNIQSLAHLLVFW